MHPLATAIAPLLEQIGAVAVPLDEREPGDVVLHWEGSPAIAVRLPDAGLVSALDRLIDGGPEDVRHRGDLVVRSTRRTWMARPTQETLPSRP